MRRYDQHRHDRTAARCICAVLAVVVALGGCASGQGLSGRTSPIQAQADDFKLTVVEGAVVGAVVGGLAGALLSGGDARRIVQGAAIGGGIGAIGGYAIAGQKQQYAQQEDALNAVIADSRQRNEKLARILTTTDKVIAQRRQELAVLKASTADAKRSRELRQALLGDLEADKRALEQAIAHAQKHGQEIDANIGELKKQFPDERSRQADIVAGEYRQNATTLGQRSGELIQMIHETSAIKVST